MSLLVAPDPDWPHLAQAEIAAWQGSVQGLVAVHHIGSTSVPGLPAKPILDLLPVFDSDAARLGAAEAISDLGYEWMGAFGLEGRSYARRTDASSGRRLVHAHSYTAGHSDIIRHLAFRDALRDNAALRAGYTAVKAACAARHPSGGEGYQNCKSSWIEKAEAKALELYG